MTPNSDTCTEDMITGSRLEPAAAKEEEDNNDQFRNTLETSNSNRFNDDTYEWEWPKLIFGCLHAFLAGWVDAISVALFRTFVTIITGNLVTAAATLAPSQFTQGLYPARHYYFVVLSHFFGGFVSEVINIKWNRPFYTMAFLVFASMLTGSLLMLFVPSAEILCLFAWAFGIQFEYSGIESIGVQTWVHTMNAHIAMKGVARIIASRYGTTAAQGTHSISAEERFKVLQAFLTPCSLALGAIFGALLLRLENPSVADFKRSTVLRCSLFGISALTLCVNIAQHRILRPKTHILNSLSS